MSASDLQRALAEASMVASQLSLGLWGLSAGMPDGANREEVDAMRERAAHLDRLLIQIRAATRPDVPGDEPLPAAHAATPRTIN